MTFAKNGKCISKRPEITNISPFGIWMLYNEREYYLNFKHFPWFENASIKEIYNFDFLHGHHLYWESLDIDLSIEQLIDPEKWPQIAKPR